MSLKLLNVVVIKINVGKIFSLDQSHFFSHIDFSNADIPLILNNILFFITFLNCPVWQLSRYSWCFEVSCRTQTFLLLAGMQ